MKKTIFMLIAAMVMTISMVSCSKCSHKAEPKTVETTTTKITKADKAHMDSIDNGYQHFETMYVFEGNVDTLSTPNIVEVQNVFQTINAETKEPTVYISNHFLTDDKDSVAWDVKVGAFWMEDLNLRIYNVCLSVEEAFAQLQKANIKRPQSKYCVLRAQLGPKVCNAQYIFGNDKYGIVFVDAVNGKVTDKNPVFENSITLRTDSLIKE